MNGVKNFLEQNHRNFTGGKKFISSLRSQWYRERLCSSEIQALWVKKEL